ncbi:TPA: inovirus-type Gp2 protein [Vibrio parahaemolyticus]|nr:inovirus-type Gp2 protein [Vibrio parahaemolyticus]HCG8096426.1 inovirus-type Gp2 protein [Vibrio parahaemolyticus]HCH6157462.1 inovirus-type Gp2 protein [Vibrio parahaemolyticus]HCH6159635.1 inovirus-type Gp2 protein [Vibrio parahaemolyticus]
MSKYISFSPVFKYKGALFEVNGSIKRPYYTDLMKRVLDQLTAFLSYHARSLVVVAVLTTKQWTRENTTISKCISKLLASLKSKYTLSRVGYVWCREQASLSTQHYHLSLFLDGAKVRYPAKVLKALGEYWNALTCGHVSWPERCYYHFHRSNILVLCDVVYRLSYFAKVRTKERTPKYVNMFGSSRIQMKS